MCVASCAVAVSKVMMEAFCLIGTYPHRTFKATESGMSWRCEYVWMLLGYMICSQSSDPGSIPEPHAACVRVCVFALVKSIC